MMTPLSNDPRLRGAVFALLALLLFAVPALAGDWKGSETTDADGLLHVNNPATPAEGKAVGELEELWRIGGETDDEDEIFGIITRVRVDANGDLYLLDSQLNEVRVFDADGSFLRSIGREGEGPGEFRAAQDMFFLADGNIAVLQIFPGRLVTLTKDGEPGDDLPLPSAPEGGFVLLNNGGGVVGDNLVLSIGINNFDQAAGQFSQERSVVAVDASGEIVDTLYSETRSLNMGSPIFVESVWASFDRVWAAGAGKAYVPTGWDSYDIMVCGPTGVERVVNREYESRERSGEETTRWETLYNEFTRNQVPGSSWDVEDKDRDVAQIYPREDGSFWVLTSRGQQDPPEGSLGVFDVFDAKGRYVQEVTLMGEGDPLTDGYFFVGDRLLVVTDFLAAVMSAQGGNYAEAFGDESEPEPMSIICYELDKVRVGMN